MLNQMNPNLDGIFVYFYLAGYLPCGISDCDLVSGESVSYKATATLSLINSNPKIAWSINPIIV